MWLGLFETEAVQEEDFDRVPPDWACPKCGENRHDCLDITADPELAPNRGPGCCHQPIICLSCGTRYFI